ncbi:hypothetical protein JCM11491_000733 [Sporobolomyces phaffii]
MFSYLASFFSPARPASDPDQDSEPSSEAHATGPSQPATNPAHTNRNRKKRLAKKKSKQRRRESTLAGPGGSDDDADEDDEALSFPDADDDMSYLPLEPDNTPADPTLASASKTRLPVPPRGAQRSSIPPQEVLAAVSRLPAPLPNGQRLPNDERAKRIIASQGFVPVEDEAGGLHVGVKVREGVVAVMGPDGPLLFEM